MKSATTQTAGDTKTVSSSPNQLAFVRVFCGPQAQCIVPNSRYCPSLFSSMFIICFLTKIIVLNSNFDWQPPSAILASSRTSSTCNLEILFDVCSVLLKCTERELTKNTNYLIWKTSITARSIAQMPLLSRTAH